MNTLNFKKMTKNELIEHLRWVELMLGYMRDYAAENRAKEEKKDILLRDNYSRGRLSAFTTALAYVQEDRNKKD